MFIQRALVVGALAIAVTAPGAVAADETGTLKREAAGDSAAHHLRVGQGATVEPVEDGSVLARQVEERLAGGDAAESGSEHAVSTTPVITSPVEDESVSGLVAVSATSEAPVVRFASGSGSWVREVPVVDGVASVDLESWGLDGPQVLTARDCDGTSCSGTETSVGFVVANAPIVINHPLDGSVVGTSVVASAEAAGGGLRFELDGASVAQDSTAPYQVTIPTDGLQEGTHTLRVVQCSTDFTQCQGQVSPLVTFEVQNQLAPVITAASPSPFSPNGDGRRDTATVSYRLDREQKVTWRVTNQNGTTVRGPVALGKKASGKHSFTFNGKNNSGDYVGSGGYVVRLDTVRIVGGTEVTGAAQRGLVVDRTKPGFGDPRTTPRLFYPAPDNYQDTTRLAFRLSESVTSLRAEVLNGRGMRVRVIDAGFERKGRGRITWNGRNAGGDVVPAGSYHVRLVARDAAGNQSVSDRVPVKVSGRRLVKKSASRTVTPRASHAGHIIGGCSEVWTPARKGWPGSFRYLSNYDICFDPTDLQMLALTLHAIKVPNAVRYGQFRVSTFGARSVPGYPDKGVVLYVDRAGDIPGDGALLRPAARWHGGDAVDGDGFVNRKNRFRWFAGTTNWYFYDVKAFKVSYSYFVLN